MLNLSTVPLIRGGFKNIHLPNFAQSNIPIGETNTATFKNEISNVPLDENVQFVKLTMNKSSLIKHIKYIKM